MERKGTIARGDSYYYYISPPNWFGGVLILICWPPHFHLLATPNQYPDLRTTVSNQHHINCRIPHPLISKAEYLFIQLYLLLTAKASRIIVMVPHPKWFASYSIHKRIQILLHTAICFTVGHCGLKHNMGRVAAVVCCNLIYDQSLEIAA